ncbi:hypothetical protein LTR15_003525 [Elasticomyces elasticus]|nr:hypothetical protein LTR15_003525 [Elasticomyces elasticus]
MDPGDYLLFDIHAWKHEIDDSPLGKRGWVIQERALSRRTIHFGRTQIAWECRSLACNEVFKDDFLRGTIRKKAKTFLSFIRTSTEAIETYGELKGMQDRKDEMFEKLRRELRQISVVPPVYDDSDLAFDSEDEWHKVGEPEKYRKKPSCSWRGRVPYDLDLIISPTNLEPPRYKYMTPVQHAWCNIIKGYTESDLSYTSDKLVAVAGIAQMISRLTQCQYLAGLWRKDLEHQLLWKVMSPSPAAVRDGTRGPSWSWPAVDGAVTWNPWKGVAFGAGCSSLTGRRDLDEIKWLARIESCEIKTITPNSFGQVASGSLVITGPLVVSKVTEDKRPEPTTRGDVLKACKHGADIFWDSKESYERFGSRSYSAIWNYRTYRAAHGASNYGDDVFFVPIRIMDYDYNNWDYESPMLQGLLLLPCVEARGTYRRVGQLTLSAHQEKQDSKREISHFSLERGSWTAGFINQL